MADFDWRKYITGGGARPDAISGLQSEFRSAVEQMIASAPPEVQAQIQVTSAFRSPNTQAGILRDSLLKRYGQDAADKWQGYLDDNNGDVVAAGEAARPWLHSIGETKWVAPPGGSNHQKGNAIDFKYLDPSATKWAHENAPKYGLNFPLANEDWHVEPAGLRDGSAKPMVAQGQPTPTDALGSQPRVASIPSPTPAPTTAAPAPTETPAQSKGLLGLDVANKGLFGIKGSSPDGIAKTLFPNSLLGGRIESGGKLLGSLGDMMTKQADANNKQVQQVAQAGLSRRAQAQDVQPQLTQSVAMPINGLGAMATSAPTGNSPLGPIASGGMDPELMRKLMMLKMMQGNFGRTA